MKLLPLYKDLIIVPNNTTSFYCTYCGKELVDGKNNQILESPDIIDVAYCYDCNLQFSYESVYIVLDTGFYHGAGRAHSQTATLIVGGKEYCTAHINRDESDASGDVAYIQLVFSAKNAEAEKAAGIIRDFAKWVRFKWVNFDKVSEFPTLVRLLGFETDKSKEWPNQLTKYVALPNALEIQPEHLVYEFTSRTVNG